MFEELDEFLQDFATDKISSDYWYNSACEDAMEMVEQFNEEDWMELFSHINERSDLWKERLVWCLDNENDPHQIKLLAELIHTDNDKLFLSVADTMRSFDVRFLNGDEQVLKRIDDLIPKVDNMESLLLLDFRKKVTGNTEE